MENEKWYKIRIMEFLCENFVFLCENAVFCVKNGVFMSLK